jgi:hypothetical protein
MINSNDLHDWLQAANERYRDEHIPYRGRPFKALSEFTHEFNCSITMGSPTAKAIVDWFRAQSAPDSHAIGALFTGAFYFDAYFWPLHIPFGFGAFTINALDCLETMPQVIKDQLVKSNKDMWMLELHWADCYDYAFGIDDIEQGGKLNSKALKFVQNADKELAGAIAQLITPRPNPRAILALRMSIEIFLKALLIQEQNLSDQHLKRLSHKLEDIAGECFSATCRTEFSDIAKAVIGFPEVSERYDGQEKCLQEVWRAMLIAQATATAVIRKYTARDIRSEIYPTAGKP